MLATAQAPLPTRRAEQLTDLCRRHQSALYRTCLGVVRRPDLAEDAVQQTFLTVLERGGQRYEGNESGWLHRVAVNASLQLLRAEKRRKRHETLAGEPRGSDPAAEEAPDVQALRGAVEALPARWRMPVLLRFQQDLSYREIAEALDCPEGTVAYRLHEALGRLRENLARAGLSLPVAGLEAALSGLPRAVAPRGLLAKAGAAAAGAAWRLTARSKWLAGATAVVLAVVAVLGVRAVQDSHRVTADVAASSPTSQPATGPATSGVQTPGSAHDAVRITFRPANAASHGAAAAATGRPPYPWTLPPGGDAAVERMQKSVSVSFTDTKLTEVLANLQEQTGVRFEIGADVDPESQRLTMRVEDLPLEIVLGLITRMHNLNFGMRLDGVVTVRRIDDPAASDEQELAMHGMRDALDKLRDAAKTEAGDEGLELAWRAKEEQAEKHLRETRVPDAFHGVDARELVMSLRRMTDPPVILEQEFLKQDDASVPKITLEGGGRTLGEVIQETATLLGLELFPAGGELHLANPAQAADLRRQADARLREIGEVLSNRIEFGTTSAAGYELSARLQGGAGVKVVVSRAVWEREQQIALPDHAVGLREALDFVARVNEMHWRLVDGVLYLF